MSQDDALEEDPLDALVAEFLAAREVDPMLEPAGFVREHPPHGDALRAALDAALVALTALPDERAAQPERIGPYRIVRELGRGGMGIVYEAHHSETGDSAAVKLLAGGRFAHPRALDRFRREAAALGRLQSDSIVAVREFGVEGGQPWFAMELVDGGPLDPATPRDPRAAAGIVRDLARAVVVAHAAGMLHRDVKPQNVRLRRSGVPVLLDFGLAADSSVESLTSTGDVIGTPAYLAPEQARGERADERTDVHGLGLVLFELLSGRPARAAGTQVWLRERIARGPSPRGRDLERARGAAIEPPLLAIVERALAWDSRQRFPTASALADDLDRYLRGEPVHARPLSPIERARERIAARPARAVIVVLVLLLGAFVAASAIAPLVRRAAAERSAKRDRAIDRATFLWLRDEPVASAAALAADPDHPEARALAAVLGGTAPEATTLVAALAAARDADQAGRTDVAARLLDEATLTHADSLALAEARSEAFARQRRHADAVTWCQRALERAADDVELWHRLARSLRALGRIDEALAAARTASALPAAAQDAALANTLAVLLDQSGDRAGARALWEELRGRFPDRAQYAFNVAFSLDSEGRPSDAAPVYRECLRIDPGLLDAAICLASIHARSDDPALRDPDRAQVLLLDALARDGGRSARLLRAVVDIGRALDDRTRGGRLAAALAKLAAQPELDAKRLGEIEAARRELERDG